MSSSKSSENLDLDQGIRMTGQDIEAARKAAVPKPISLEEYVEFLQRFPAPTKAELLSRTGPRGDFPFELLF